MGMYINLSASVSVHRRPKDGIDGKSAIEIEVQDAPLIFDTDVYGTAIGSKTAKVYVRQNGVNVVEKLKSSVAIGTDSENMNVKGATVKVVQELGGNSWITVTIDGSQIIKDNYDDIQGTKRTISRTSGFIVLKFTYDGVEYHSQIQFSVNVATFYINNISNEKEQTRILTEVSKKYDALPEEVRNKENFTEYNSAIKQTAREISLSLTERLVGRRNLLLGSDFLRQEPVFLQNAGIEINSGYEGSNCVHAYVSKTKTYSGVYWEGKKDGVKNISIVKGKKYTMSCWAKVSDNKITTVKFEMIYQDKEYGTVSGTKVHLTGSQHAFTLDASNAWQLLVFTFSADKDYAFASANVWLSNDTTTETSGYISRVMLEEGETYNGWTLHQDDETFVAGNMLSNTRFLSFSTDDRLTIQNVPENYFTAYDNGIQIRCERKRTDTGDGKAFVILNSSKLQINTDYVFSFLVKGSRTYSEAVSGVATIKDFHVILQAQYNKGGGSYNLFAEDKDGTQRNASGNSANENAYTEIASLLNISESTYRRVWVHFRFGIRVPDKIYLQIYKDVGYFMFAQPKLEQTAVATAWTEAMQDVASKNELKRTGIDIEKGKITLDADNTIITGDLHLKGILVENTAEPVVTDTFPIVCDLKQNKSIAVGTYTGTENYGTGSENKFVVLPMYDDTSCINENGKETIVAGLKESGVKLSIFSKYNPNVAKWATAKRYRYLDTAEVWGMKPYKILHAAITVVYADPRIAFKKNYYDFTNESDGTTSVSATIKPQGDGTPSYNANRGYKHGCFVCNGRRGRMLLLMPGQTLHITSSIEKWNGENVLMWYIDNASEFVPVSKQVIFERDGNQEDYTYTWVNLGYSSNNDQNHDSSFPGDFVNNDTNLVYEDVLFAPPQLSRDYPASDEWGMDKVLSKEALTIPLF